MKALCRRGPEKVSLKGTHRSKGGEERGFLIIHLPEDASNSFSTIPKEQF